MASTGEGDKAVGVFALWVQNADGPFGSPLKLFDLKFRFPD